MTKEFVVAALLGLAPLVASGATLEERVEALERRDAGHRHLREEKPAAGPMAGLGERLSFSGFLEAEAAWERLDSRAGDDGSASDLVLATAQVGLEAEITEHVRAALVMLFEEDATDPPEVDEASVAYARAGWFGRVGRQYVPFGAFPSHFISDPVTLELGETRETALLLGYEGDRFSLAAFGFRGDAERVTGSGVPEEGHLKDWGLAARVKPVGYLEFGASFLSDLADTDAALLPAYRDRVPGWSAFAVARLGQVSLSGEGLGAIGAFRAIDLDADGDASGDRPLAWNVELAWEVLERLELAARVEGSRELAGGPELQCGAVASWGPWERVSLSLEYLRGEFDPGFGAGIDSRDRVVTQVAVEL